MQIIKRKITRTESKTYNIKYFGLNSKKILSIILEDDTVINITNKELYDLKKFLEGVRI